MQCDYGKEDKFKHVRISKIQRIFMEVRLIFFFKVLFSFVKGRHGRPVRYLILGIFFDNKVGKVKHVPISKSQQIFLLRLIYFFKIWYFVKGRHGTRPVLAT